MQFLFVYPESGIVLLDLDAFSNLVISLGCLNNFCNLPGEQLNCVDHGLVLVKEDGLHSLLILV